jgi:hypothetical protein
VGDNEREKEEDEGRENAKEPERKRRFMDVALFWVEC